MKKTLLILCIFLISLKIYSQNSRNVWRMGYHQGGPEFIMDFNSGTLVIDTVPQSISMYVDDAGICDSSGRLLFYTNGVSVCNSLYLPMSNGDSLASFNINQGWRNFGIPLTQGSLVLPDPANKKMYYLFQTSYDDGNLKSDTIFLNKIDMNQDGGLGMVVIKNQPLYIHSIVPGQLTAVNHANGRDWWLISHNALSNEYVVFFLSPFGLSSPSVHTIGSTFNQPIWATFSPNGEKYACAFDNGRTIDLLDFDRCSGTFSNYIQLNNPDTNFIAGCSFSPNSEVLYMSAIKNLYQYDLKATNIDSSGMLISTWDGFTDPYMTAFCFQQLAPDGKIYITGWGSVQHLNVINFPDSIGISCDVSQHSIHLPGRNNGTMPNYPFYDLGAIHGSICDSLPSSINSSIVSDNIISFYPNPCQNKLYFNFDPINSFKTNFNLIIKNVLGQNVANYIFSNSNSNNFTIDLSFLSSGLYVIELQFNGNIYTNKFLKN